MTQNKSMLVQFSLQNFVNSDTCTVVENNFTIFSRPICIVYNYSLINDEDSEREGDTAVLIQTMCKQFRKKNLMFMQFQVLLRREGGRISVLGVYTRFSHHNALLKPNSLDLQTNHTRH